MHRIVGSWTRARRIGLEAGSFLVVAWLQRQPCPSLAVEIEARDSRRVVVRRWGILGQRVPGVWKCVTGPTCRIVVGEEIVVVVGDVVAEGIGGMGLGARGIGVWRPEQRQVQRHEQVQEQEREVEAASGIEQQAVLERRRTRRCSVVSSPCPCRRRLRRPRSCTFGCHRRPRWKMVDTASV
jgi:hypothetical protein